MEALLYFVFWGLLIFLMMRLGCGSHIMGHEHAHGHGEGKRGAGNAEQLRWVPPATDTDPVCRKRVNTNTAKPSVYDGYVYYFCSRDCREVFEAAPDLYLGESGPDHHRLEHSHA